MKTGRTVLACAALALAIGCNARDMAGGNTVRRLSIATGGTGGVYYPYGGGIAKIVSAYLPNVEATAEATAGSVDNLKFISAEKSDIAFTLADTLDDAVKGRNLFEEFGAVPARALAVLYVNYLHLVVQATSSIDSVAALKGRVVSTGAAGSGTELIAMRVLEASGIHRSDVTRQALNVGPSADALKDGKVDAFFWSGGLPTAAVLDLSHTPNLSIRLLPSDAVIPTLQQRFGQKLYFSATIPKATYPGMPADVPVVGVANLLVVNRSMPDDLAYQITKLLFDKQSELAAIHPEARSLSLATATVGSPAPFHPGAARFYKEHGITVQ
jgi:TRAP transporter TAXI family solute receptor